MDEKVFQLFSATIIQHATEGAALTRMIDRNLSQIGGTILELQVQAQSGVQDDPAIFAGLNTAARIPQSGALPATS